MANTERATSKSTPKPGPTDLELAKIGRAKRDRVVHSPPLPLHQGCSEGERSEVNDRVLFHNHIERLFAYAHIGTYSLFFSPTLVTLCRIKVSRDLVPAVEVTATNLLRLQGKEEATHPYSRASTWKVITQLPLKLNHSFCASEVDRNSPHATETMYFWLYIPEDDVANLAASKRDIDARGKRTRR